MFLWAKLQMYFMNKLVNEENHKEYYESCRRNMIHDLFRFFPPVINYILIKWKEGKAKE